jgi:hypothetical protein
MQVKLDNVITLAKRKCVMPMCYTKETHKPIEGVTVDLQLTKRLSHRPHYLALLQWCRTLSGASHKSGQ